ncbi:MAG: Gfo/Idh/MocA family oxidoreductase [Planctomycetota bacterium]|nr:Gfo/Idh/MocA family oxidoreductase [Planctomycetota bacterium]
MIKVAMIGCGGMGNAHAPTLVKLPNVQVVAACDLIPEKAKSLAEKNGIRRHCTDFRELLPDVDAVWVCTEPFNRVDIVTTCAKARKHIFTEKPICRRLADADTMIAATRRAKVKYMLGYCLRFWPMPYGLMHDTFASGELGELVSCWMRRFMPWDPQRWYAYQEKSGGVMLDFGSHDMDWLRWVGGDVKTVFARTFRVRQGTQGDDHGGAVLLFKKGGMATVEDSWGAQMSETSIGIVGTKGMITVGNDGKVRKRIGYDGQEQVIDGESAIAIDPKGNLGKRDASGAIEKVAARAESIQEHFFRCIEEGAEPRTPAADGRKTLLTVMALWESARTGKAVDVDSIARKRRKA